MKEEIPVIIGMLVDLEKALIRQAESTLDAIMPGYTHLQRAQPITFAHATMLGEQGVIAKEEADKIVETLKVLLTEIEDGKVEFTKDSEDIHMNMEVLLTERIGATGKRLHTARSRNDQVGVYEVK